MYRLPRRLGKPFLSRSSRTCPAGETSPPATNPPPRGGLAGRERAVARHFSPLPAESSGRQPPPEKRP